MNKENEALPVIETLEEVPQSALDELSNGDEPEGE